MLGAIDDFWYKWVADVGITGADRGAGGKYLVLPPGYKGEFGRAAEHLRQLDAVPLVPRRPFAQALRRFR